VGIETAPLNSKSFVENGVALPPFSNWSHLEPTSSLRLCGLEAYTNRVECDYGPSIYLENRRYTQEIGSKETDCVHGLRFGCLTWIKASIRPISAGVGIHA
jgi:hypothetical protein